MAITRFGIDGYGQLELNQVAFPTTGTIEAQCKLDTTDFKKKLADAGTICEVGMLLAVDKANNVIKLPTANETLPIGLNYTTEYVYDSYKKGLKHFALVEEAAGGDYLPRIGYLTTGDKFTTNCLAYDTTDYADEDALETALEALGTTAVYGGICTNGAIRLMKTIPTAGPVLKAVKFYTMPDGQPAVKFQVIKG